MNAQWFVARQLGITNVTILSTYAQRETTRREHTALIRNQYQYREFTWPWSFQTTLDALQYLSGLFESRKQLLEEAPLEIVSNPWKGLVFDKEGRVTKRGYTLCFLDKLQDSLRRRDIYVENSDRWGDPRAKLLQGQE
jgi:hypothetical protein